MSRFRRNERVGESRNTSYSTNPLNQCTEICSAEPSNQLSSLQLSYDDYGNMTSVQTSTGTWNVEYNAENRPVRFENTATQTVVECAYDSQGRRFEKKVTVAGTTTMGTQTVSFANPLYSLLD